MRLAEALPTDRDLTVVTNSLPIAQLLVSRPTITVHLAGGRIRGRTMAAVDDWAVAALRGIFADVAFIGANGISPARGLTTPDRAEAAVKAAMIAAARRTVVLADHTKVGADHFARFGDLSEVDLVITDSGLDPELAHELEVAGPEVVRA
jgi:DeoR family transcriptional regulator, fructose operon transcriptional repressor